MGALTLPSSGSVYGDKNTVIYSVEKVEPYKSLLDPLWAHAKAGRISIITSELTWLETLAKPMRDNYSILESLYRAVLTAREVTMIPATLATWEQAARLRGLGLKTPNALHSATGLAAGCALFLTNDTGFQRVPGLPVSILNTIIAS